MSLSVEKMEVIQSLQVWYGKQVSPTKLMVSDQVGWCHRASEIRCNHRGM